MFDLNRRGLVGSLAAAPFLTGAAASSSLRLARGINVHHVLSWPDHIRENPVQYRWPPYAGPGFDTAPEALQALKRLGFDFVRFGIDPAVLLANAPRRAELMRIVISRVQPFLAVGLSIVFDLHPTQDNPAYTPERVLVAGSPAFENYVTFVRDLAATLRELPQNRIALEMLNEPPMAGDAGIRIWQRMLETLHAAARAAAPQLTLVMTGCNFGGLAELTKLDVSAFKGSKVLYTFHYYDPHIFTHQGINSPADFARYVRDVNWPPRPFERRRVQSAATGSVDGDLILAQNIKSRIKHSIDYQAGLYFRLGVWPEKIAKDFAMLAGWARRQDINSSQIFMGEFGARRPEVDNSPLLAGRMSWVQSVRKVSE